MKLSSIKPNINNPRVIKDDRFLQLVDSIEKFPEMLEKRPLVCVTDTDGRLYPLAGNMRYRAFQHLGMEEIPDAWVVLADDWTVEQRAEFMIKDNVSFGGWDFEELKQGWDPELLQEWAVELPASDANYFDIDVDDEPNDKPSPSQDGYSTYELIMLHDNKLRLISALNKVKSEHSIEKQEDALMVLIDNYFPE